MKRLLWIPLTLCLLALLCGPAWGEETAKPGDSIRVDELNLNIRILEDGTAAVDYLYKQKSIKRIVIPETVRGYTVTEIDFSIARDSMETLEEVVLPDTIRSIGERAFSSCSNLKKINLPETLELIGYDAFYNCRSLTGSFSLPNLKTIGSNAFYFTAITGISCGEGLKEIGDSAFSMCEQLKTILLPTSVEVIGQGAFSNTKSFSGTLSLPNLKMLGSSAFRSSGITGISFGDQLEEIPDDAFYCSGGNMDAQGRLAKVNIPASVKRIGSDAFAFQGCLPSKLVIPDSVQEIGEGAFKHSNVTSVTLPDHLLRIPDYLFQCCEALTAVKFSPQLKEIGRNAFESCRKLKKIALPDTVESIGAGAFAMTGLTAFSVPPRVTVIQARTWDECESLASVTLPSGIVSIEDEAFSSCKKLAKISLPDSVEKIGASAFSGSGLKSIVLPKNLKTIEYRAFSGCQSLTSVTFPEGLETINFEAFKWTKLKSIHLFGSVQYIGREAFATAKAPAVQIDSRTAYLDSKIFGVLYENSISSTSYENSILNYDPFKHGVLKLTCHPGSTVDQAFTNPYLIQKTYINAKSIPVFTAPADPVLKAGFTNGQMPLKVIVPEGVVEIGDEAFMNLPVQEVQLPSTLKKIGDRAFDKCYNLKKINLPKGLTEIGDRAFAMTLLENVALPNTVTTVADYAFAGCYYMKKISLPSSLISIGTDILADSGLYDAQKGNNTLGVTAPKGSQAESYIKATYPKLKLKNQ